MAGGRHVFDVLYNAGFFNSFILHKIVMRERHPASECVEEYQNGEAEEQIKVFLHNQRQNGAGGSLKREGVGHSADCVKECLIGGI